MEETQVHLDAFELYYSMKASRSYKRVAEVLGVSKTSVDDWGKAFNWQERLREREKEIAEGVAEKLIDEEINIKVKLYKAIGQTVDKYTEKLLKDGISIETVKDLEVLGKLWKELEYAGIQPQGVDTQVETVNNTQVQVIIEKPEGVE